MRLEDISRFSGSLSDLCVAFHREQTESLLDVYFKALSPLEIIDVEAACARCIAHGAAFPTPKTIWDIAAKERVGEPIQPRREGERAFKKSELKKILEKMVENDKKAGIHDAARKVGMSSVGAALMEAIGKFPTAPEDAP